MNNLIHREQKVVTTSILANKLGADENQLKNNFARNKERYMEGVHFFLLKGSELKEFKGEVTNSDLAEIPSNVNQIYLWTEKGAFNHVKSLGTDEAWDAYQTLVNTYFRLKEIVTSDQPRLPQTYLEALKELVTVKESEERLLAENAILTPKAEFVDAVLASKSTFTVTEIANELGLTGAALNKILVSRNIQYKNGKGYLLYANYNGKGYTETRTHPYVVKETGATFTEHYTVWTERGRVFIHHLVNERLSWSIPGKKKAEEAIQKIG